MDDVKVAYQIAAWKIELAQKYRELNSLQHVACMFVRPKFEWKQNGGG